MSGKIESNLTREKGNLDMIGKRFVNPLIQIFLYYYLVILVNCNLLYFERFT